MTIWEFLMALGAATAILVVLLDTDWKRKLLRRHGEKNP